MFVFVPNLTSLTAQIMLLYIWPTNQQILVEAISRLGILLKILKGLKDLKEQKLAFRSSLGIMVFDVSSNVFRVER